MSEKMEFWSMQAAECAPAGLTDCAECLLQGFIDAHPGCQILRAEHQTCSIGSPNYPRIMLSLLIHFRI